MTSPILSIKGLTKSYGKVVAVSDLSLDIERGETVVIMGPSGCGKSTTIRCIDRLTEPDGGSIVFDGVEMTALGEDALSAVRRRIGFVFQGFNLVSRLSCLDNVALGVVTGGCPTETARACALVALEKVGLIDQARKRPGELSGGQQQRVGIARALVSDPELMLWDEPTASLDPILVRDVLDIMEDLAEGRRRTMVVVTHELAFARRAATRVVLMDGGKIVEEGSPEAIFALPRSEVGRRYRDILLHAGRPPG